MLVAFIGITACNQNASTNQEQGKQQVNDVNNQNESLEQTKQENTETVSQPTVEEISPTNATPTQIRCSHILIPYQGAYRTESELSKEDARKKAEALLKEIEGGADFAALAKEHSSCPSSQKGGDLGKFGRGAMVAAFDQAAFELDVNEVSSIVETQFGFHIIKRTE
jgi:parvulin-like peptidyl-prolyl isomerase